MKSILLLSEIIVKSTGLSLKLNIHRNTYIVYDTFECKKANIR